jgi:hypothetical protein
VFKLGGPGQLDSGCCDGARLLTAGNTATALPIGQNREPDYSCYESGSLSPLGAAPQ